MARQSLITQLKRAMSKGEDSKFVQVPCEALYMTESVLKEITFMVNSGKMVPIRKPKSTERRIGSLNQDKPIKLVLFRTSLGDHDEGDEASAKVTGQIMVFCGKDNDFAETQKWIEKNPYEADGPTDGEIAYPADLFEIMTTKLPSFGFEDEGVQPGGKAKAILDRYNVSTFIQTSPPNVDPEYPYIDAYLFYTFDF